MSTRQSQPEVVKQTVVDAVLEERRDLRESLLGIFGRTYHHYPEQWQDIIDQHRKEPQCPP